jgi:nucleoside-triphosphatase THEP1
MITLLTAPPRTGKSTIIDKLIRSFGTKAHWVVAKEVTDNGSRVGFEATNSHGQKILISHKSDIESEVTVGDYRVDIKAVNAAYLDVLKKSGLKVLDEIGNMQLSSAEFTEAIDNLLKTPEETQLIASIHAGDKRLKKYRSAKGVIMLTATTANRDIMAETIAKLEQNEKTIESLTYGQFSTFKRLLTGYLSKPKTVQIGKLLDKALPYIANNKVTKTRTGLHMVAGNHGKHSVNRRLVRLRCDCDLFNGAGTYKDASGECSHIQAVKILSGSSLLR